MGQYTSYYLYQKYESRGGQNPLPVYPYVYSIDGEGTLSRVVKLQSDPACGGGDTPAATYQWVNIPISTDYWCDGSDKHYKQKQQVSYDNGSTWQDVVPASYRMGALYQSNSPDCGYLPMERWTNSGTTCQGVDKYQIQVKETSTDGGSTWHQTSETRTVLLEANSPDCGGGGGGGYETKYLTFKTLESGTFTWKNSVNANNVYYSIDSGTNWTILYVNESTQTIAAGREVWWKASGLAVDSSYGIGRFAATGRFNVEGNVMSLVYGDNFETATTITNNYQFEQLFYNCSKVVSAENLVLPATTLTTYCYASMFYYCTALTTAPTLPATTLANNCYSQMFFFCSSLNNVTCLATDISARNSTYNWMYGVAASGTFYKASSMSDWPRTNSGIPSGWTVQNA